MLVRSVVHRRSFAEERSTEIFAVSFIIRQQPIGNREMGRFYESLFGMRSSKPSSDEPRGAAIVGDGYVGLNINSRAPGRQSGLDHFGFEVEDVETVYARLHAKYPKIKVLHRPGGRSFAGISTHDPAGNVFDLSKGVGKRRRAYEEGEWQHERHLNHSP